MAVIQRKEETHESADPIKMYIPDIADWRQDPPESNKVESEQYPKLQGEPTIKVGIIHGKVIEFSFDSEFISPQIPGMTFIGKYTVMPKESKILFSGVCYDELTFSPCQVQDRYSATGCFTLENVVIGIGFHWERTEPQSFKGSLSFIVNEDDIIAINEVAVESYLFSVIAGEMSAAAGLELLKTQAVISRSWLLKPIADKGHQVRFDMPHVSENEISIWYERDAHTLFDVCADDHCQRYQGITRSQNRDVISAIEATAGEVLVHDNHICDARFSKSCGGVSELFENCWSNTHHDYLTPVADCEAGALPDLTVEANADEWIRNAHDSFCNTHDQGIISQILNDYDQETPDFYRWRVEYTTQHLSELIKRRSGIDFGTILALEPLERGTSGRITRLRIKGSRRTMTVGKELEIRRWLSESHLYSSAFVVDKTPDGFTLIGAGWGHGVGLCQIGAAVMGAKGYKYRQILKHYFSGSQIRKLY